MKSANSKHMANPVIFRAALFIYVMTVGHSASAITPEDIRVQELFLVRELVQLETEKLLSQVRQIVSQPKALSLSAIYGVGNQLIAEIQHGQQRYRYKKGQSLPIGVEKNTKVHLLQELSSSCVTLMYEEIAEKLCLQGGSEE